VSGEGRDVWIYSERTRDVTRATYQRDGHDAVWMADGKGLYYLGANGARLDVFRIQLGTTAVARPESMFVEVSYTGTQLRGDSSFLTTIPGKEGRGLDIVRLVPRKTSRYFARLSADGRFCRHRWPLVRLYLRPQVVRGLCAPLGAAAFSFRYQTTRRSQCGHATAGDLLSVRLEAGPAS
jgi:hypothetical protein